MTQRDLQPVRGLSPNQIFTFLTLLTSSIHELCPLLGWRILRLYTILKNSKFLMHCPYDEMILNGIIWKQQRTGSTAASWFAELPGAEPIPQQDHRRGGRRLGRLSLQRPLNPLPVGSFTQHDQGRHTSLHNQGRRPALNQGRLTVQYVSTWLGWVTSQLDGDLSPWQGPLTMTGTSHHDRDLSP